VAAKVNVHEAKTQFSKLLERVRAGEEIVISKAGEPCAKLVPIAKSRARKPGLMKGRVTDVFFEPLPEDELKAWDQ